MDRLKMLSSVASAAREGDLGWPVLLGLARSRTCVDITRAVGLRINRADGGALSSAASARNCCRSNYSGERP
jgi:hypothetical protein